MLTVADSGPGMDAETLEHAFERFYRADPSRARTSGGAGLGLAIVAAVVEAHGGTVEIESEPGTGTTFRLDCPAALLPHARAGARCRAGAVRVPEPRPAGSETQAPAPRRTGEPPCCRSHDRPHDREPEPVAAARPSFVRPAEAIERARGELRRDACALVDHVQLDPVAATHRPRASPCPRRA